MPVSRRRYDDLQARYQNLAEDHAQLKEELASSRGATLRLAGQYTHLLETGEPMPMFSRPSQIQQRVKVLERRIHIARKAAGRLLAAYFAAKKQADVLQTRLDYALGLNSAAVEDGKNWQAQRTDKPAAKETSS